jgi:NAD(P)-dependent dehydrogenase (short-subunit alcohol dehydrogenase family)
VEGRIRSAPRKNPDIADWFYVPSWSRTPAPALSLQHIPKKEMPGWLVFADQSGLGSAVLRRLRDAGHAVVAVTAGAVSRCVGERTYTLDPKDREGYRTVLEELRGLRKGRNVVLFLWNVESRRGVKEGRSRHWSEAEGFCGLLALAQAAGEVATERLQIDVVSNSLQEAGGDSVWGPERAVAHGPSFPDDVNAREDEVIEQILSEALTELTDPVVAYRGRQRWVQTYQRTRLPEVPAHAAFRRDGGVYLITGGLGGIGLALGEQLVETVGAKLVLVGRSGLPPREEWKEWLAEHENQERTSRRILKVRGLEERGAEILVVRADVSNTEDMRSALAAARERFGELHGVIHAAGTLEPHMMDRTTPEMAEKILSPKIGGTRVLAELLEGTELDFFVLCSSISTVLGGLGLADYCAANAFLDAYAHSRDGDATPVVSVNWDAWADVGMTVDMDLPDELSEDRLEERREALGMGILSAEGKEAFLRILSNPGPQIVVAPQDLSPRLLRSRAWVESGDPGAAGPPGRGGAGQAQAGDRLRGSREPAREGHRRRRAGASGPRASGCAR